MRNQRAACKRAALFLFIIQIQFLFAFLPHSKQTDIKNQKLVARGSQLAARNKDDWTGSHLPVVRLVWI